MSALTVDVNPKVLVWARNELNVDVPEIAEHLKVDIDTVEDWETHGKDIKYTDLKRLARYYKRQLPIFFLLEVPSKVKKPKDYRNLNLKTPNLHKDTLMAIRRTNRYLALYRDATDSAHIEKQYEWLKLIRSKADTTDYLRELLDAPVSEQRKAGRDNFKFWRRKIEEKLGIFIFQFPIPNKEFDGFSYIETGKPFAITINSQITSNRKVFTIFHELGHIIEGESGICFTSNGSKAPFGLEAKCNHFAAEFLMPEDEIIPPCSYVELKTNADGLGVSAEAFLIRCKTLSIIPDPEYKELMAIVQKKNKEFKKKEGRGGAPPPVVLSKSQRGDKFFDFVVTAYDTQRLSSSAVRDVLGVRVVGLSRQDR